MRLGLSLLLVHDLEMHGDEDQYLFHTAVECTDRGNTIRTWIRSVAL